MHFQLFRNFGLVLQKELSGWCFNERSKGIYASCVLVAETEDLVSIFLSNETFEPLYKRGCACPVLSREQPRKDCEDNFDAVGYFLYMSKSVPFYSCILLPNGSFDFCHLLLKYAIWRQIVSSCSVVTQIQLFWVSFLINVWLENKSSFFSFSTFMLVPYVYTFGPFYKLFRSDIFGLLILNCTFFITRKECEAK